MTFPVAGAAGVDLPYVYALFAPAAHCVGDNSNGHAA
jgi:hypothetical protein